MGLLRFAAGFLLEDKEKLCVKFYRFTHSFLKFYVMLFRFTTYFSSKNALKPL